MFRPRDQNASGKIDQTSLAGFTHKNAAQRPTRN